MYYLTLATLLLIYATLALSLNLITGLAGQVTLGHAAFFGIGAYVLAFLVAHGINFWLALFTAGLIVGVTGLALGAISLRLREDYLAIATIGINFVVVALFLYLPFFGGAFGMSDIYSAFGDVGILLAVVVEDLSLWVAEGEWVSLIGPNGAGKSSTIKAILGLVAHEGRVALNGEVLTGLPAWARQSRGLGYMPEGRRLFSDMTVEENLRVGAYRLPEARVRENLTRIFDLFPRVMERRRQVAKTLSGGEQQMVALGRALMGDPHLLLVDEASLGLMPLNVQIVFEALAAIHRKGSAILLVEQNARKALDYAQHAYVLEVGRLQLSGTPDQIRQDPRVIESYLG